MDVIITYPLSTVKVVSDYPGQFQSKLLITPFKELLYLLAIMTCLDVIRIILASINVFVNGLGALYGLALIAQAVVFLILLNVIEIFSNTGHLALYNTIFFICIAIGVLLLLFSVVAITGSCIACCPNNTCLKVTSSFILVTDVMAVFVVFLLGITGVVLIYQYRDRISTELVPLLNMTLSESYTADANSTHLTVVAIQEAIGCCGVSSPSDFATYPAYPLGEILPDSCCEANTVSCNITTAQNGIGCGTYLVAFLVEYSNVIGGFSIAQVVIIFLLMVLEIALIALVVAKKDEYFVKV